MSTTLDEAKAGYQQGQGYIPATGNIPAGNRTVIEMASLGYQQEARAKELKRPQASKPLNNVLELIDLERLPEELRTIAQSPPAKEDARYLPPEVQRLVNELATLNKAIDAVPQMERGVKGLRELKDSWTGEAIRQGITDRKAEINGLSYPFHLDTEERALSKIQSERDSIIRGAKAFAENNPDIVDSTNKKLEILGLELQANQPYQEAKSGLNPKRKTVRQWLDDVQNKASLDDRLLAQQVLDEAEINHKAILTELNRQGLSETDKAIEEYRDKEKSMS